jgi:hypothetical protein
MCKVMVEDEYDGEGHQVGEPLPPDEPAHVLVLHEIKEKENEKRDVPRRRSRPKEDIDIPVVIKDEATASTNEKNEKGEYIRTFV